MEVSIPKSIINSIRGKLRYTTIESNGKIEVQLPDGTISGYLCESAGQYYVTLREVENSRLFRIAGVERYSFCESILGYIDKRGDWPYMHSVSDVVKVLTELDRLYLREESKTGRPESLGVGYPSTKDIDFTPKKKHYSFNFGI